MRFSVVRLVVACVGLAAGVYGFRQTDEGEDAALWQRNAGEADGDIHAARHDLMVRMLGYNGCHVMLVVGPALVVVAAWPRRRQFGPTDERRAQGRRAHDAAVRTRVTRFAAGLVGLAAAVYAIASLTGGWLGTPPWWTECVTYGPRPLGSEYESCTESGTRLHGIIEPQLGREWISGGIAALGLAGILFAACLRRSMTRPPAERT